MKKLYWQSHRFSRLTLLAVCLLSFASIISIEQFKTNVPQNFYNQKLAAAVLAEQCMTIIKNTRIRRHIRIETENDPQRSGIIGEAFNYLTSGHGSLNIKQTTINPNFAALVVTWLKQIGIKRGDTIAIGMNGSYPALNIAVLAAAKTLELKPIVIVSMSTTQWGANIPKLLWLDMLHILNQHQLIPYRPIAASLGGTHDRLQNMMPRAKHYLLNTIKKYQIPFIDATSTLDGIDKRMRIYAEQANNTQIKVYINIGAVATVYEKPGKHRNLKPGLNTSMHVAAATGDSVMLRFMKNGVPVINLTDIATLAEKYELPIAPATRPPLGQGSIFFEKHYNPYLTFGYLIAILGFLVITTTLNKARFNQHYNSGIKPSNKLP